MAKTISKPKTVRERLMVAMKKAQKKSKAMNKRWHPEAVQHAKKVHRNNIARFHLWFMGRASPKKK